MICICNGLGGIDIYLKVGDKKRGFTRGVRKKLTATRRAHHESKTVYKFGRWLDCGSRLFGGSSAECDDNAFGRASRRILRRRSRVALRRSNGCARVNRAGTDGGTGHGRSRQRQRVRGSTP